MFIKAPPVDKEVLEILPGKGKKYAAFPYEFSAFWEKELWSVDNHLRLLTRLSSFQLSIVNYLLSSVEHDDSPTGISAIAELVNDITAQQLKTSNLVYENRDVTKREYALLLT